jgi:hypothetical protein
MSTYTKLDPLDFARGVRLSHAAMALRVSCRPELLKGSETIVSGWLELDGVKLADMPMAKCGDEDACRKQHAFCPQTYGSEPGLEWR